MSVSSGTVTVLDDASVQIVAEEAAHIENLDIQVRLPLPFCALYVQ